MAFLSDSQVNWLATYKDRKRAPQHRFNDSLQNLTNLLFQKKEAKNEREFTAGENEKTRTYMDTPFADGPRSYTDQVTGKTFTYNTPREYDALTQGISGAQRLGEISAGAKEERETLGVQNEYQKQLQDDAQAFQSELQGASDAAALARLEVQLRASREELERVWEQPREAYEERSATVNGRTYKWSSDQEYELVQLEMQQDMINDRIALENAGVDFDVMEAFDRAYGQMLANHPDWWVDGMGWQLAITSEMQQQLEDELRTTLEGYVRDGSLEATDIPALLEIFKSRIRHALAEEEGGEEGGEQGPAWYYQRPREQFESGGPPPLQSIQSGPRANDDPTTRTFTMISALGGLGLNPQDLVTGNTKSYPQGVEGGSEQMIFDQLFKMYGEAQARGDTAQTQKIDQAVQRLVTESVSLNPMQFIQQMLGGVGR